MLERTAELEVLREVILPVKSEHRLALLCIVGITFERYVYCSSGIDNTLVEDCNLSGRIVHAIVGTLLQSNSSGSNDHRSLWHVVCAERYHVGRSTAILSRESELILFGNLLGDSLCRIVKFSITVFCSLLR